MKQQLPVKWLMAAACVLPAVLPAVLFQVESMPVKQRIFEDNGAVFQNPHMGFAYATNPDKYLRLERKDKPENPPAEFQIIKLIILWKDVEPSPDVYDWTETDEAIRLLIEKGHSINARFLMINGKNDNGVPEWIYNEPYNVPYIAVSNNCKGLAATEHPYYWNPVFQERAKNILSRFAERYDIDGMSWMDVRIYGHAGEWDAGNNPFPWEDFPDENKTETLRELVNIYADIFTSNSIPVAINPVGWEYTSACHVPLLKDESFSHFLNRLALDRAYDAGFGIRLDDVRGWNGWKPTWTTTAALQNYAASRFVVGETGNGWDPETDPPANIVNNALALGMTSIAYGGHRVQGLNLVTNYPAVYELGMKNLGYRLLPVTVQYPEIIHRQQNFSMNTVWENRAVGRLMRHDYHLRIYLKDAAGAVCWESGDFQFDPWQIINGNSFDAANPDGWHAGGLQHRFKHSFDVLPAELSAGEYRLFFAIAKNSNQTPAIRLPIDGDDGALRYFIGGVNVE